MLTKFEDAVLEEPSGTEGNALKPQIFKWELKLKKHHHDVSSLEEGNFALWSLARGQTSYLARTKIKSAADFLNQEQDKGFT